jgi:hypothetical protein
MEANCVPSKKPEYGLIILGNAGAGKSYICNMIIGYERFETDFRREAVTTTVDYHRIDAGPSDLVVYNIPGLIESYQAEIDRNKREIIKAFEQSPISVVMFVWTQVGGRPLPDDIIAFKALKEAYKFSPKSLMFVLNNIPSNRPSTYEGKFFALLTKMLNPMPISLENMFFLDTLNSEDNEKFGTTHDRLLHFIAHHHENEQKMQADIIIQSNELRMLREALKEQYLEAEKNKQELELQIKQMAEEYEAVRKGQEKRYQDMVSTLEVAKQQVAEEEKGHELVDVELEALHKEKKTGLRGQCQQLWKKVEDERGIFTKVEKSYQIGRNELRIKYGSNKDDEEKNFKTQSSTIEDEHGIASKGINARYATENTKHRDNCNAATEKHERKEKVHGDQLNRVQKKPDKLCNEKVDSTLLGRAAIGSGLGATSVGALGAGAGAASGGALGAGLGAASVGALGAAAGAVAGGVAGIILGPCAIATAAAGAAAGTAVGAAVGAVAGAAAGTVIGAAGGTVAGVTIGGISGAIATLYRFRKR